MRRIELDLSRSLQDARDGGHTRWHPAIEPLIRIAPGEVVRMDARDGGDVQIRSSTAPSEAAGYDMNRLHPLTGPFFVEGVEPGDLLDVEILAVEPGDFAWSRVTPGGGGLMRDDVHDTLLVRWRLEDGVARSEDLPGVAIPASPFIGTIGVAPSHEQLTTIAARERALSEAGGWALHPAPENALPDDADVVAEGLRTLPPREFGGNLDVKEVAAGSTVSLMANVPGGLLSIGDLHFGQGDGESYGSAMEMCGAVVFRCAARNADDLAWTPSMPVIESAPNAAGRDGRRCIITTGTSVDEAGVDHHMDLNLAARNALNEMVDHLVAARGLSRAQAQVLVTVAGDLRINVVNNPPNPIVSVALPLDVFDDGR